MSNLGIKSTIMYEVKSNYGLKHDLSLILREYKYGKCIYILKLKITYYIKGIQYKRVFKKTFNSRVEALHALKISIYDLTIENINDQLALPF